MQRITLKTFGPINNVDIDVRDILLFIGPQAVGKSTISKAIFFFKSLKDDFTRYILDSVDDSQFDRPLGTFAKRVRKKFLDFWGSSYHMEDIFLQYNYGNKSETINVRQRYVNPEFNLAFKNRFNQIVDRARRYSETVSKGDLRFLSSSEMLANESEKRSFFRVIEDQINELFNEPRDIFFVPAGRSLLATLSEQLPSLQSPNLDYLMNLFVQRINNTKALFRKSLEELVRDRKKLTQEKIEFPYLTVAQKVIHKILKAKYIFDYDGEKLYYTENDFTRLKHSSSGQQESIWILLLIFIILLENRRVFIVFEEPEAHLFPEAQQDIVHLMALLSNVADNQVIITTHSPYVLTSYNNLLLAHQIGQRKPEQARKVIDDLLWIDHERLGAYFVANGEAKSIVDTETGLIKAETIDAVSSTINRTFDQLINLDELNGIRPNKE